MDDEDDEDGYRKPPPWPLWVAMGLWGMPSRGWAWTVFWGSVTVAVGCIAYGFIFWPFFAGSGLLLAAIWFYAAIRWVDRYGDWP